MKTIVVFMVVLVEAVAIVFMNIKGMEGVSIALILAGLLGGGVLWAMVLRSEKLARDADKEREN